jgi:uncharacterized protein
MADRARLAQTLIEARRVVVAVSGGIDSLTLATFAWGLVPAGLTVSFCFADGAAVPKAARSRVHALAEAHGFGDALVVIDAGEVRDPAYLNNPVDRCYHCKSHLFDAVAAAFPDVVICTGANLDDVSDFRPGRLAARERAVQEPFITAGFAKDDVRALARDLGLGALSELPASPCLSSRVETGVIIDEAMLSAIDAVEERLREEGARVVRCRIRSGRVVIEHDGLVDDAVVVAVAAPVLAQHQIHGPIQTAPYAKGSAFVRPGANDHDVSASPPRGTRQLRVIS